MKYNVEKIQIVSEMIEIAKENGLRDEVVFQFGRLQHEGKHGEGYLTERAAEEALAFYGIEHEFNIGENENDPLSKIHKIHRKEQKAAIIFRRAQASETKIHY